VCILKAQFFFCRHLGLSDVEDQVDSLKVILIQALETTLRTDLGGCDPSLCGDNPVVQEGLVVGVGLNQRWLQSKRGCK
jgi:hypothetical protein